MRLLVTLALVAATPLLSGTKEELTWTELPALTGRILRMTMPHGVVISGKLTAVEPEALVLQIRRTTDSEAYPKGRFLVPRSQVKVFSVLSKGKRYRVIGTICGAWLGLGLGTYAAIHTDSAGAGIATLSAVGGGLTTLGYFLGDAADGRTTTVVIRE
jgi:hypothetical protein